MDLWLVGRLSASSQNPEMNSDYLRGRVVTLEELTVLSLEQVQGFYRQDEEA